MAKKAAKKPSKKKATQSNDSKKLPSITDLGTKKKN